MTLKMNFSVLMVVRQIFGMVATIKGVSYGAAHFHTVPVRQSIQMGKISNAI